MYLFLHLLIMNKPNRSLIKYSLIFILIVLFFTALAAVIYKSKQDTKALEQDIAKLKAINNIGEDEYEGSRVRVGGVIRHTKNGKWYLLDDRTHTPIGIENVEQDERKIRINFAFPFDTIHWSAITNDENLTMGGYDCGAGVALTHVNIFCTYDGKLVHPKSILSDVNNDNIWFYVEGSIKEED